MWLVDKGARTSNGGDRVDPALAETLRIWYQGDGDHIDEQHALVLVRHARRHQKWIACDCRGNAETPMLSPALLTEADTYYLRRLAGPERIEHTKVCPFHRAQQLAKATQSEKTPARNIPDGYFAILKPPPVALAQAPDVDAPPRDAASHGTPRLAKLLWRLLEACNRTTIPAQDEAKPTIKDEFAAIKRVAAQIEVAPGIALDRVLFTHPRDARRRNAWGEIPRASFDRALLRRSPLSSTLPERTRTGDQVRASAASRGARTQPAARDPENLPRARWTSPRQDDDRPTQRRRLEGTSSDRDARNLRRVRDSSLLHASHRTSLLGVAWGSETGTACVATYTGPPHHRRGQRRRRCRGCPPRGQSLFAAWPRNHSDAPATDR